MTLDIRDYTQFAILYRPDRYLSESISHQSLEITKYWTETYNKNYIISESLDDILEKAAVNNFKYCLIQESGNMIFDHSFYKLLTQYLKDDQWFAIAHIIAKETTGIHPQTILVNVDNWIKIGKPAYQDHPLDHPIDLVVPKRSSSNIHDDYTPYWIIPSKIKKSAIPCQPGWGWINSALSAGLAVKNFTPTLRKYKIYLYPENLNLWYDMQSMILNSVSVERTKVFFDNTEGITGFQPTKDIENFYVVASGFKPNIIVESCGFDSNTTIIYYDYSGNALEFKKWLHKNWNGQNYVDTVRQYVTDIPALYESVKFDEVEAHWQIVLESFGGDKNFEKHWQRFNNCRFEYMYIDIVGFQRKYLIDRIDPLKKNAIWWSHAFNTFNSLILKGKHGNQICYDHWISDLKNRDPNIVTLSCYDCDQQLLPSLPIKDYDYGSL